MKWEYKIKALSNKPNYIADKHFENQLNLIGEDGWELVGVTPTALYFKRPIDERTVTNVFADVRRMLVDKLDDTQKPLIDAVGKSLDESP